MSRFFESPFFKAFATTNSLLLGAGALYFVAFGNEKLQCIEDIIRERTMVGRDLFKPVYTSRRKNTEGIEDFSEALSDWNKNLVALEDLLVKKSPLTTDGFDEVDAVEIAGYHNSSLTFEKLDKTLHNVVGKVGQLRQLLKSRYNISYQNKTSGIVPGQDFDSTELALFKDEDSEAESFLSAESDVEDQNDITLTYALTDLDQAKQKALETAGIYRNKALYVRGLEQYFNQGIKCRKKRAKMVGCSSDTEFLAKVHCIREASKIAFADEDVQDQLEKNTADLISFLIRTAGKDHLECQKRWGALVSFCRSPENWKVMESELSQKGVPFITFYDVVLDFVVMDAFVDLENPPYAVQATVQNRWLPTYIQQTGLETAVWGVLKAKMQMVQEPAGFLMHFYHLSEILTPVLAWGFLGSDDKLSKACDTFKEQLMGFVQDLFNFNTSDYGTVESLAKDIPRLAVERYELLKPLLAQPHLVNGTV